MPMPGQHQQPLLLSLSPVLPQVTLSHTSCFLCSTLLVSSSKRRTFLSIKWDFCSRNTTSFPGGPLTEAIKVCVEVQLSMGKQDIRAVLSLLSGQRKAWPRYATPERRPRLLDNSWPMTPKTCFFFLFPALSWTLCMLT